MTDETARQGGTRLTTHELLYILSSNATDAANTTREHLRLGDAVKHGTPMYAAGATTLVVRGMAEQRGDRLLLRHDMHAFAALLTNADRWVEIGLLGQVTAEGALVVSAGTSAATLAANDLGMFTATTLEGSDAVGPHVVQMVRAFLAEHEPGGASIRVTDHLGERRCVVHHGEDGRWQYGTDPANDDGTLTAHDIDESDVDALVASVSVGTGLDRSVPA